jgi:hypothetical protein
LRQRRGILIRTEEVDGVFVREVRPLSAGQPVMHQLADAANVVAADLLRPLAGSLPLLEVRFPDRRRAEVHDRARIFRFAGALFDSGHFAACRHCHCARAPVA